MTAKITFKQLLEQENECIMVPCIYDCGSALAAELSGQKATLLSGGELGETLGGFLEPMLTTDEVVHAVENICSFSSLPMIVDVGAGFETPLNAYRTSQRMVAGGAMALLLGNEHGEEDNWDKYQAILKATLAGVEGSECIVIARRNGAFKTRDDLEKCVRDMTKAVELGAAGTMTCVFTTPWVTCAELAHELGERIPGWKIYPDQNSENGVPNVVNEEIYKDGYKMISYHYMMKVALAAMWEYGLKNMESKNNVPSNEVAFPNGVTGHSGLPIFDMQRLFDLEAKFTGVRRIFRTPGTRIKSE